MRNDLLNQLEECLDLLKSRGRHNVDNNIGFTGSGGRFNPKLRQIAFVA